MRRALITEANAIVQTEVVAHERDDEGTVYPAVARALADGYGLSAMSRAHREILHLARLLARITEDLPSEEIDRYLIRDAQRAIEAIEALVRIHTAQEEDIYDAVRRAAGMRQGSVTRDRIRITSSGFRVVAIIGPFIGWHELMSIVMRRLVSAAAAMVAVAASVSLGRYHREMREIRRRVRAGGRIAETARRPDRVWRRGRRPPGPARSRRRRRL